MNINRETKPQLHSTRVLLKLLFRVQIAGLYRLVEQFGGENLAVRLDQIVRDTAQLRNWSIRIEHGLIHNMRTDLSWRDYSAVMGEALSFAITAE